MVIPATVTGFVSPASSLLKVPVAAEPSTVTASPEITPLSVSVPDTDAGRVPSYSLLDATVPFTVTPFAVMFAVVDTGEGN